MQLVVCIILGLKPSLKSCCSRATRKSALRLHEAVRVYALIYCVVP